MGNLLGHGSIDYIVVYSLMAYAVYAGFTKPHRILFILPACLSFFFFIEVGPRLTPDKLVPVVFVIATVASKGIGYYKNSVKNQFWIITVLIMVVFSTVIGSFYSNYYSSYLTSSIVGTRLIIQAIGYLNYMLIFIIVRKECTLQLGVKRLLKSFLITTSILSLYGVYQFYANEFGWPYRGIVYSDKTSGFGGFNNNEELIFRVNSLANEPKRLTYFIVIGILIILKYYKSIKNRIGFFPLVIVLIFHFVVLWLTYSTSIYFVLAVFITLLLLYSIFRNYNGQIIRYILFFGFLGIAAFAREGEYLNQVYDIRVEGQLESNIIRSEVYGQEFMVNNPGMFVIGLGPGVYNLALAKEYPGKAGIVNNGTFLVPFNSDLLIFMYDFGIIGFFILFIPFINIAMDRKIAANRLSIYVIFMYSVSLVLSGTATLFFLLGAFEAEKNRML